MSAQQQVLIVYVEVEDARELRRIESRIWKLGKIMTEVRLRMPDLHGRYQVRRAVYVVLTDRPRELKIMLSQLENNSKASIFF